MGLVLHQACRALAARDTGPHTVGFQVSKGNVPIEAGAGTGWATLIKHKSTVQGAAHHTECRAPPGRCHSGLATAAGIGFQNITEAGVS